MHGIRNNYFIFPNIYRHCWELIKNKRESSRKSYMQWITKDTIAQDGVLIYVDIFRFLNSLKKKNYPRSVINKPQNMVIQWQDLQGKDKKIEKLTAIETKTQTWGDSNCFIFNCCFLFRQRIMESRDFIVLFFIDKKFALNIIYWCVFISFGERKIIILIIFACFVWKFEVFSLLQLSKEFLRKVSITFLIPR